MKNRWKKLACLLLTAVLLTSLSGCGKNDFDATAYVRSSLDCIYKEKTEEYQQLTDATPAEAAAVSAGTFTAGAATFMEYFGVKTTDADFKTAVETFYQTLYAEAKYEVGKAKKADDGFTVEVMVDPINVFPAAEDNLAAFLTEFNAKLENGDFNDYTKENYEAAYAKGVLEVCTAFQKETRSYAETRPVTITVKPNAEGIYSVTDEDWAKLDQAILLY